MVEYKETYIKYLAHKPKKKIIVDAVLDVDIMLERLWVCELVSKRGYTECDNLF